MTAAAPNRRTALALGLFAGGLALAGCRVQAEGDAPALPGLPRRATFAGEDTLRALLAQYRGSATLDQQHAALTAALVATGVTKEQLATPTNGQAPSVGSEAEARALEVATAKGPPALFPVTAAISAQRIAASALQDRDTPKAGSSASPGAQEEGSQEKGAQRKESAPFAIPDFSQPTWPTPAATTWRDAQAAQSTYAAAREAQAIAQASAALIPSTKRDQLSATTTMLATLARWASDAAGASAPTPTLGYQAPTPKDAAQSEDAVRKALVALQGTLGSIIQNSGDDRDAVALLVHALGRASTYATIWGAPESALPGFSAQPTSP